jgi:hypothetical protein
MKEIIEVKKAFMKSDINDISSSSGIKDFDKYMNKDNLQTFLNSGIIYPKGCPIYAKAAMTYNYMIAKHKLPYGPFSSGSKIKYIYVNENNEIGTKAVGFIGKWPKEFDDYFVIDRETQFLKTIEPLMGRFFDVLGFGKVRYEEADTSDVMQF